METATAPCPNLAFGRAGRSASALGRNSAHSITGRQYSTARHRLPQNGVLFRLAPRRCHARGTTTVSWRPHHQTTECVPAACPVRLDWAGSMVGQSVGNRDSGGTRRNRPMAGGPAKPAINGTTFAATIKCPTMASELAANETACRWAEHDGIDIRAGSERVVAVWPPIRPRHRFPVSYQKDGDSGIAWRALEPPRVGSPSRALPPSSQR